MALRVVTPPAEDAALISLEEAKAQLEVVHTRKDVAIQGLIDAALDAIETDVQRRYFAQTLEWVCDTWPLGKPFPIAGANHGGQGMAVESITYVDLEGNSQVLDPSQYWVRPTGETIKIVPRWFVFLPLLGDGAERVVVRFTVPDGALRKGVKHAAKLLVAHWYFHPEAVVGVENRDSSAELPLGVNSLLWRERWEAPADC
jgi:uncharacterized phiE125 gp8 family phage protein